MSDFADPETYTSSGRAHIDDVAAWYREEQDKGGSE